MSIEVCNITKTFGRFRALDGINLTVPDGELVALLGPSGSGKTTLLRIIAGLESPDSDGEKTPGAGGQILFHGEDVVERPVAERRVGFVFQHYALFRHMTVFKNVAFGLEVRPRKDRPSPDVIRGRVMALLRLVQLENLAERYPSQLSGGQRQRIALARALAVEPRVMLLDEPFGALDAKVRQGLRRWLRRLHDEVHLTSVFVTHDQEEALEVADRIVVMNRGRIEQVGTPTEVFHSPANPFVMDFLGHVNLFHGRMEDGKAVFAGAVSGAEVLPRPVAAAPARLFVRPYELDIDTQPSDQPSLPATIARIHAAGPLVRIELSGDSGEPVQVEMPHDRFHAAPFNVGDHVFVRPRQVRVFNEDFSI